MDKNISFLRDNPRSFKSAINVDAIKRVLEKYIDFTNLYIRQEFSFEQVKYLDRREDIDLVLQFIRPVAEERIEIYTVVRGRFIEFSLEIISPAGSQYPPNSYITRINSCAIALDKREHERIVFDDDFPRASGITTIKIHERESDLRKSLSVRMIVEEYINKIEGVDVKKVFFKDDKDITPAVAFVMQSGKSVHIADTSVVSGFFSENEEYFETTNSGELRENLRIWLQNNSTSIKSLLVRPIMYQPLVGKDFPVAYLNIINRVAPITDDDAGRISTYMEEISERIRNGNLIISKSEGDIIDVSVGGVKISLNDAALVDKLVSQNIILLDMNFKENNSITISGRLVWIFKRDDGSFLAGIDFSGSRFGPKMKGALVVHIKDYLSRRNRRA